MSDRVLDECPDRDEEKHMAKVRIIYFSTLALAVAAAAANVLT